MGATEGIAFEEGRARTPWAPLRPPRQERFDRWRDTLETPGHEPPSTLPEVTAAVGACRQQRTGGIPETMVTQAHEGERQRPQAHGPQGPRVRKGHAHVWRTVETMGGPVACERPSLSCRACRGGGSPCDDALGWVAGCQQLARPQAAVPWVTAVPYATAHALFGALTGLPCGSERRPPRTTQGAAGLPVGDVAPARREIARRIASLSAGRLRRPVVVLGLDGAYGPPRPDSARAPQEGRRPTRATRARWRGQWRDATGWRFSRLDGARLVHGRRGPQGQNDAQRGEARTQSKAAGLMPEAPVRRCVVCDGAAWRWPHVQALFPQARQGLDADHGAQDLPRVARAH